MSYQHFEPGRSLNCVHVRLNYCCLVGGNWERNLDGRTGRGWLSGHEIHHRRRGCLNYLVILCDIAAIAYFDQQTFEINHVFAREQSYFSFD